MTEKPFYQNIREALQDKGQTDGEFFVDQMDRAYDALKEAHKNAKRNEQRKAVFYYRHNGRGRVDGTINIDLEYIDAHTNQFKSLNYIAAIITSGVGLRDPEKGVEVYEVEYPNGAAIIAQLSMKVDLINKDPTRIESQELPNL
ncbi:MAG: hypothetical protein AAFP97_07980 [Pseudomonadota bacterium]